MKNEQVPQATDYWQGSVGPVTIGKYEVGIGKLSTAVGAVGGTLLASSVALVGGVKSPVANFDVAPDLEQRQVVSKEIITTKHDALPQWVRSEKVAGATAAVPGNTEYNTVSVAATMPDVANFDLSRTPASQVVKNEDEVRNFAFSLKDLQTEGWNIVAVERNGLASDETRLDGEAGLGTPDEANVKLAGQYGEFVDDVLNKSLQDASVSLENVPVTKYDREVVMDEVALNDFKSRVRSLGYDSPGDFMKAYKANPEAAGYDAQALMSSLETERGANIMVTLARDSGGESVPVYRTFEATRCVEETVVNATTAVIKQERHANLPLVPFILPALRARRRQEFIEGQTATSETKPEAAVEVPAEPVASVVAPLPEWATRVSGRVPKKPKTPTDPLESVLPAALRRPEHRGRRLARRIAAGAVALAGVLSIRFDAGYCPDPQNYPQQHYDISKGPFPDSLYVGVGIPFTDIQTDKMAIVMSYCDNAPKAESSPPAEPTCDTKYVEYVDGKLRRQIETNHPGALTVTETTGN